WPPPKRSAPTSPRSSTRLRVFRLPTSSSTSRSPTTWTSTRCRWSRSSTPLKRSSASASPTKRPRTSRRSATRSPTLSAPLP
ncbi:MAG: Acyl carrier protein, partial [uncultured Propionibacteriaceae bacterium]